MAVEKWKMDVGSLQRTLSQLKAIMIVEVHKLQNGVGWILPLDAFGEYFRVSGCEPCRTLLLVRTLQIGIPPGTLKEQFKLPLTSLAEKLDLQ